MRYDYFTCAYIIIIIVIRIIGFGCARHQTKGNIYENLCCMCICSRLSVSTVSAESQHTPA